MIRKFYRLFSNIYFFLKERGVPGSLVIVSKKEKNTVKFLLINSKHSGATTFPSGHLNPFQDFWECALQELYEETGLKIDKEKLVLAPVIHRFRYKMGFLSIPSIQRVFYTRLNQNLVKLTPKDKDVRWARWFTKEQTLSLLDYEELRETFKNLLEVLNE
jgi:8-oxo-dGTP pyrophosphatase MutT (NUDIX family)